jgi:hypothetical protein
MVSSTGKSGPLDTPTYMSGSPTLAVKLPGVGQGDREGLACHADSSTVTQPILAADCSDRDLHRAPYRDHRRGLSRGPRPALCIDRHRAPCRDHRRDRYTVHLPAPCRDRRRDPCTCHPRDPCMNLRRGRYMRHPRGLYTSRPRDPCTDHHLVRCIDLLAKYCVSWCGCLLRFRFSDGTEKDIDETTDFHGGFARQVVAQLVMHRTPKGKR